MDTVRRLTSCSSIKSWPCVCGGRWERLWVPGPVLAVTPPAGGSLVHMGTVQFRVPLPSTWLVVFRRVTSYPTNFQNKQKQKTRGVVIRWTQGELGNLTVFCLWFCLRVAGTVGSEGRHSYCPLCDFSVSSIVSFCFFKKIIHYFIFNWNMICDVVPGV